MRRFCAQTAGAAYPASTDDSSRVNFTYCAGTASAWLLKTSTLSTFRHFSADRNSAKPRSFPAVRWTTTFGTALALARDATLQISCEAVMWKITTRGFTLAEVLIMAAMNLKASGDSAGKREKRTSQK
jgi:hypothetical protein